MAISLHLVRFLCLETTGHERWNLESKPILLSIVTRILALVIDQMLQDFTLIIKDKLNQLGQLELH